MLLELSLALTIPLAPTPADELVPGNSWMAYGHAAEAGFDAEALADVHASWRDLPSSAFMVIAEGAVVAAWGDVERRFMCHSVRKSFMSGLYGVFHDAGVIELEVTLAELGIDDIDDGLTDAEKTARIEDLLRARSGVYRLAAYEPPQNPKPPRGSHLPGRNWCYNNWDFNTLCTIFQQVTEQDVFEAFERKFAVPLELEDWRLTDGYYHYELEKSEHPAYPFRMSARDMARFGLLYMRSGRWADERLLSRSWIDRSTCASSNGDHPIGGYGYMWWVFNRRPSLAAAGMYAALGVGNQLIAVLPERGLVIVNRANTYEGESTPPGALQGLIEAVLDAQVGSPVESPELVPLAASEAELERRALNLGAADRELVESLTGTFPYPAPSLGFPVRATQVVTAEGARLLCSVERSGKFRWDLMGDGRWFEEDTHGEYVPIRDAQGRVEGFATVELVVNAALQARVNGADPERLLVQLAGLSLEARTPVACGRLALLAMEPDSDELAALDGWLERGHDPAAMKAHLERLASVLEEMDQADAAGRIRELAKAAALR